MPNPKITLLVPTYRRPASLERTITSILEQSYTELIIRVYDNGSDDKTYNLMRRLMATDDRIEYKRNQQNIGALSNFDCLVKSVETPFYALISDDDLLLPGHIESGVRALLENPEAFFYSSATITADLTKNILELRNQNWVDRLYQPTSALTRAVIDEHFTSTGTIFRRSLIPLMGGFHALGADDIFSVILVGCFPFCASPEPGAVYTISEGRGLFHGVRSLTLEKMLIAAARDRKSVLDYSVSDITGLLLEYLEIRYSRFLENKAIQLRRLGPSRTGRQGIHSYSALQQFLVRRSIYVRSRVYLPETFLGILASIRAGFNTQANGALNGSNKIANIEEIGVSNYLRCSDLSNREEFITAVKKLTRI
jgi:glycosyltransferase involved in cell wall biosynthesis